MGVPTHFLPRPAPAREAALEKPSLVEEIAGYWAAFSARVAPRHDSAHDVEIGAAKPAKPAAKRNDKAA